MTTVAVPKIPKAFIWRRLHSLMGLWLVLFLIEHLLTNSQAALWLGDNGQGFVRMVNALHNLPYLQVVEITLLGVPILLHGILGIQYLLTAKPNAMKGNGTKPYVSSGRNFAYSWQRITSWLLLVLLVGHVIKFRFLEYPDSVSISGEMHYFIRVDIDDGLYTVADRLHVALYDKEAIVKERDALNERNSEQALTQAARLMKTQTYDLWRGPASEPYNSQKALILNSAQKYEDQIRFVTAIESKMFNSNQCLAITRDFGTATLLAVRNTFKNPVYVALYTIFVLAACFHACNGFWTFLITWGWVLKMAAQRAWVTLSVVLMLIMLFLGLAAVWGTYWCNLKF